VVFGTIFGIVGTYYWCWYRNQWHNSFARQQDREELEFIDGKSGHNDEEVEVDVLDNDGDDELHVSVSETRFLEVNTREDNGDYDYQNGQE